MPANPSYEQVVLDHRETMLDNSDMSPHFAAHNSTDRDLTHVIDSAQLSLENGSSSVSCSNRSDIVFSQQCSWMTFTPHFSLGVDGCPVVNPPGHALGVGSRPMSIPLRSAPLLCLVGHVVDLCSEPQVAEAGTRDSIDDVDTGFVIPDTSPHVAGMEHMQIVGDRGAAGLFISEAVRSNADAISSTDATVTLAHRSNPQPTGSGLVNPGPKSALGRRLGSRIGTCPRAVLGLTGTIRLEVERRATVAAVSGKIAGHRMLLTSGARPLRCAITVGALSRQLYHAGAA